MSCPDVLVVLFNRPDVAARLIASLRPARPARLWVAADGPRRSHSTDIERCARTRAVLDQVDWPCEVTRLFHDRNLGLQRGMVEAIDWFFTDAESGIVLEDDCLPHPDYFRFAAEVLDRYRDAPRVMGVSALNMAPAKRFSPHSYFFASAGHLWGWATWRRAWEGYDGALREWPEIREAFLREPTPLRQALARKFDSARAGRKHTWARAWHYHVARHSGLVVVPSVNLVRNVGLGPRATHTTSRRHLLAGLPVSGLRFPLDHPDDLVPNADYDACLARFHTWSRRRRARELVRPVTRLLARPKA